MLSIDCILLFFKMTIVIWKETAFQKWHFLFEELWTGVGKGMLFPVPSATVNNEQVLYKMLQGHLRTTRCYRPTDTLNVCSVHCVVDCLGRGYHF